MTDAPIVGMARVLDEVAGERGRQMAQWREQNHPDGTGPDLMLGGQPAQLWSDVARSSCEHAFREGSGTWAHILAEEFWEAMECGNPTALRKELLQVAAVAVAWIEAIDRRQEAADYDGRDRFMVIEALQAEERAAQVLKHVEGLTVSVDISTGDDDATDRIFAEIEGAQVDTDGHSIVLLAHKTGDSRDA